MIDPDGMIARPEASANHAIQEDPGSIRVGALDLVRPHPCFVQYLSLMHHELDAIMESSTLLSLRSSAFLTWEDRMEASHTLQEGWMKMISELPLLPADMTLEWLRDVEGQGKARQLQGIVFQKAFARNALVNEMLEWSGAAKAGEERVDLSLRDGLKGVTLGIKQQAGDDAAAAAPLASALKQPAAVRKRKSAGPPARPLTVTAAQFGGGAIQQQVVPAADGEGRGRRAKATPARLRN